MGSIKYIDGGNHVGIVLLSTAMILLLAQLSSATFHDAALWPLDGAPGIWRGKPKVTIIPDQIDLQCRICADDTYWSAEVADAICQNYGFERAMIIEENVPVNGSELDGYVVCKTVEIVDISSKPLSCELTDVCNMVPTISCLLPGYSGCYSHTVTSPFFPANETAPAAGQPYDIQTCAAACSDFPYLGLTDGQVCVCGSELGIGDEGVCDVQCEADNLQACGAATAISTYEANVIGKCNPERVDLMLNQTHYITSPNFPDNYVPGEPCTWEMGIDLAPSHNLDIVVTFEFNVFNNGDNLVIYTEPSGVVRQTIVGLSGRQPISFNPVPVDEDTLKVQFTPPANATSQPGAGFSIKILITDDPTGPTDEPINTTTDDQNKPTDDPTITDEPMTTSQAGQRLNMNKLAISAVIGVVLSVAFLA